ncbi:MAG TPA: DUF2939 domain-containing protein [Caulobacteraceae bacterium]|jgi:hypothetical protein
MIRRWTILALTLALAACATAQRIGAAGDVHALLISIRDDDSAGFDAHIDRPALEQQLEARILQKTQGQNDNVAAFGAALAGPLSRLAGQALLQPQVFRAVAEYYGYSPDMPIPDQLVIAGALRALPDGKVCAAKGKGGPCVITFADENGVWRLVSFDGDVGLLKLH